MHRTAGPEQGPTTRPRRSSAPGVVRSGRRSRASSASRSPSGFFLLRPDATPDDTETTAGGESSTAPDDDFVPSDNLGDLVPPVNDLVGTYDPAREVATFTWAYDSDKALEDDSFWWRKIDPIEETPFKENFDKTSVELRAKPGEQVCIEVIVDRDGKVSAAPQKTCVTGRRHERAGGRVLRRVVPPVHRRRPVRHRARRGPRDRGQPVPAPALPAHRARGGIWWLANVGSLISATVCDSGGGVQSWLSPGNRLPIVFPTTSIVFTAGPTTYEITAQLRGAPYQEIRSEDPEAGGATTIGMITFTTSQKQLIVALAEPMLRRDGTGLSEIRRPPRRRLGSAGRRRASTASSTTCDKLDRIGVRACAAGPARSRRTAGRGSSSTPWRRAS